MTGCIYIFTDATKACKITVLESEGFPLLPNGSAFLERVGQWLNAFSEWQSTGIVLKPWGFKMKDHYVKSK